MASLPLASHFRLRRVSINDKRHFRSDFVLRNFHVATTYFQNNTIRLQRLLNFIQFSTFHPSAYFYFEPPLRCISGKKSVLKSQCKLNHTSTIVLFFAATSHATSKSRPHFMGPVGWFLLLLQHAFFCAPVSASLPLSLLSVMIHRLLNMINNYSKVNELVNTNNCSFRPKLWNPQVVQLQNPVRPQSFNISW